MSTPDPRVILVVEPYLGGSHAAWLAGLARHSRHRILVVSHPAAFWRWRLRGSALTLAAEAERVVDVHGPPDVVLASDMVHLPAFLGFGRRFLDDPAVALYLHESQLLYPDERAPRRRPRTRPAESREGVALVNWLSMVAADRVVFNSEFHREALFAELPALLSRSPDEGHTGWLAAVRSASTVLPVGVEVDSLLAAPRHDDGGPPVVLWNQRWDHDKRPRRFFAALYALEQDGVDFRLAVAGHNERVDPREFTEALAHFADRLVAPPPAGRAEYEHLLLRSDVVVSTAAQETFGIAVIEALAAGCIPVLPCELSYPEVVGAGYAAVLHEPGDLRSRLRAVLEAPERARADVAGLRESMARFAWRHVAPRYDELFDGLTAGRGR